MHGGQVWDLWGFGNDLKTFGKPDRRHQEIDKVENIIWRNMYGTCLLDVKDTISNIYSTLSSG